MKYKFKDYMYTNEAYKPYYSKYKGHEFIIVNYPFNGHIEIQCVTNPTIIVDGLVHISDLEKIIK
jgi:hypothetical protein